jgi:hypothetical protein
MGPLATGNRQLATGNWQLATGNWQLAKQSKAKQSKAKQSKAKQSKAKQSKAKRFPPFLSCAHPTTTLPSPPSLPIQRPGLITRQDAGAPSAPKTRFVGVFFRPPFRAMAAVRGRPSGLPGSCISGLSACAQLPPNSPDNECGSSQLIWEFYR